MRINGVEDEAALERPPAENYPARPRHAAGALQRHDLRIDGRIGGFIGLGADNHFGRLVAQRF